MGLGDAERFLDVRGTASRDVVEGSGEVTGEESASESGIVRGGGMS